MNNHRATIITIGDEILIGQIIDTNSAWLSDKLFHLGFNISEIRSIKDEPEHIKKTLDEVIPKNNLIILTGGLGPTNDDRTKIALNDYFGGQLVINNEVLSDIESFVKKQKGSIKLSENNRAQALVSSLSEVLRNSFGTAPVQVFKHNNTQIISLPGVPFEMKHLFTEKIIPKLTNDYNLSPNSYKTFHIIGYPESELASKLKNWENNLEKTVKLAYLPSPGVIRLRISDNENNESRLNKHTEELQNILGKSIISEGKEKVEHILGKLLSNKELTISVAESCTGGLISHKITNVPGASNYFIGSVTAYSNDIKINLLKVKKETIKKYGAVSEQTAKEMAIGVVKLMGTNIGISTTGIAGPTGGSNEKPIGTLWIGIYINGEVYAKHLLLPHNRKVNINRASTVTMYEVLKNLT